RAGHAQQAELVELIEGGMGQHEAFLVLGPVSVEVAAAADVVMADRCVLGIGMITRWPVELVVEDRFDRAIGQRADLDGARGGGVQPPVLTDRASRKIPRHARKPCSGCGRRSRISAHNTLTEGPIASASRLMRSIVQSA